MVGRSLVMLRKKIAGVHPNRCALPFPHLRQRSRLLMRFYNSNNRFRLLAAVAVLASTSLFYACGTTGVTANQTSTAGTHLVDLSWNPSTTSSVVKYKVYRSAQSSGPFDLLNSASGATYTDSTVQSGQTYYYAVTSVDSAGVESGYSNVAVAIIPTP